MSRIDPRGLAALRIGLGTVLLVDLVGRYPLLAPFFTADGVMPPSLLWETDGWRHLLPHALAGSLTGQQLLWVGAAGTALLLTLGWQTRWVLPLCWLLTLSTHHRNPLLLDGGDTLLRLLLFWGMFLPLGDRWAVGPDRAEAPPRNRVAEAALLLQPVLMYLCAGLFKVLQPEWRDGTAVAYVVQQLFWLNPAGAWLATWPSLMAPLTYAVVAVELVAPVLLIWPRPDPTWRWIGLGSLVVLQLGLGATIELGLFPWIATLALLPYLPAAAWDRVEAWRPRRASPTVTSEAAPRADRARRPAAVLATLALALVLLVNIESFSPPPRPIDRLADVIGLAQSWTMYDAPGQSEAHLFIDGGAPEESGWLVSGHAAATRAGLPVSYRTKNYLEWMTEPDFDADAALAAWVCRKSGPARETVTLQVVTRHLRTDGQAATITTDAPRGYDCP